MLQLLITNKFKAKRQYLAQLAIANNISFNIIGSY